MKYNPKIQLIGQDHITSLDVRIHIKYLALKTCSFFSKFLILLSCYIFTLTLYTSAHATSTGFNTTKQNLMKFTPAFDIGGQPTHAAIQDREGFLWFGSFFNGLVRFDGTNVKLFNSRTTDLSNDFVTQVMEDSEGVFWIGTNNGLNRYDKKTNTWKAFFKDSNNPENSIAGDIFLLSATTIIEDRDGLLWFGTSSGLSSYDRQKGKFKNYLHELNNPNSLPDNEIRCVLEDRDGLIWIATHQGLAFIDKNSGIVKRLLNDPNDPDSLPANDISSMIEDKEGILWFASKRHGLIRYDKLTNSFKLFAPNKNDPESVPDINIQEIYYTRDGKIVFLDDTEGVGLAIFDPITGKTWIQNRSMNKPNNLATDAILGLLEDKEGVLWVIHNNGKVDKYDPRHFRFEVFTHDPNNPNSIAYNQALPIYEDNLENLWIGTFGKGLERFDKESKHFIHYGYNPDDPTALPQGYPCGFFEDKEGNFYVSTFSGLVEFDRKTGKVIRHLTNDTSFYAMIQDHEDEDIVWAVGWDMAFNRFNLRTSERKIYKPDPKDPDSFAAVTSIRFIAERENPNIMWIATWGGGLEKFDKRTEKFTHHQHNPNDPTTITSDTVYDIIQDREGRIWVTTDKGFNRLNPKTGKFKRFGKAQGFNATIVNNVTQDLNAFLWLGTDIGIVKFDPNSEKVIKTYSVDDGLVSHNFWPTSRVATKDGRLFFGGFNGVNLFRPESLEDNKNPPLIYLTSLQQEGEIIKTGTAPEILETLQLDWRNNSFDFEYVALNYLRSMKNQYQYMLEGFDRDWYNAKADRKGRYVNLPGGEYILRIRGTNNDGVWSLQKQEVSLPISISVPPWKRWWAYTLYTIIIFMILASYIQVYKRKSEREKRVLEDAVQNRTQELIVAKEIAEEATKAKEDIHKKTRDSIEYASLIQSALIPNKEDFDSYFDDSFVIWQPKDIVGGDIYLIEPLRNENELLLMVIDCTGHGVPGSLVTMLVKAIERQITSEINNSKEIVSPAKILSIFNKNMKHLLKQESELSVSNAGFDGAILYYNKADNIMKFSAAESSLFIIDGDTLKVIKGDRHSIGYKKSDVNYKFKEHIIDVNSHMQIYMTTDGYIDQNGGDKGFPFGKTRLKQLLQANQQHSMSKQREVLLYELQMYQNSYERNDDITVVGISVKPNTSTEKIEILNYHGIISQNFISTCMDNIELKVSDMKLRNDLSTIVIEVCQNMMNYSKNEKIGNREIKAVGFIEIIQSGDKNYSVKTENIISIEDKNSIESKLIEIQSLDRESLRKRYRELRRTGKDKHEKGAGIGLYEIAKLVKKVHFQFEAINEDKYKYILHIDL